MANKENINLLIKTIKENARFFNMRNYVWDNIAIYHIYHAAQENNETPPECGSPACICGWANKLSGKPRSSFNDEYNAERWLGIEDSDNDNLFCPPAGITWSTITVDEAVKTLEILRDTGVIDWSHARKTLDKDPSQ